MNRDSNSLRNFGPNQTPRRWWIVLMALVLAMGSTGQTPPAQAAQPAELVVFSMDIKNPKTTLGCKETVTYLVSVELAQSNGAPTPVPGSRGVPKGQSVINMKVEAQSVDRKVGDFIGTESGLATAMTSVVLADDLAGLGARFKFKAKKAGKTTLHFQGLVGEEYVSTNLDVEVLPCNYKVEGTSVWNNGPISLIAILDGEIQADDQGNLTGTSTVNWDAMFTIPDGNAACGGSRAVSATDSQADLTGNVGEDGQMAVTITYLPTTFSMSGSCSPGGGSGEEPMAPTPLAIHSGSLGTVVTQTQTLSGIPGLATIRVIPVDDETAAYIPGRREASRGAFSSLLGALLAWQ